MSGLYVFIVGLLFILAISDLIVGVSNDAVNFLNSSIGSRVASRKTIMIVASIGIFAGATFSSGMMEVARKGIFNPEFFFFGEIMIIFLAVMLTDIILLDFFNTIGLPTSTTVSIVFELLGAAVVMSLIKVISNGEGIAVVADYINTSQAALIISGIFLSVVFAFGIGVLVQFISRLIFTFRYKNRNLAVEAVWTGLAMTAMTYFLVLKGLKGASFASAEVILWIENYLLVLSGLTWVLWIVIMYVMSWWKVNTFRIVVLFGTFALAMAFAGNDLVNFIGVPIAGFESFLAWSDSGQGAFSYSMNVLKEPVRTQSWLLIAAGLVMIITLWFSKKARSVTETEVNLSRQSEGHERFAPNRLAKGIVGGFLSAGSLVSKVVPVRIQSRANNSFKQTAVSGEDKPAFDLVRAGVNLTTASVLIALATSFKLPLSTTYVSFMVAMGTSLADRAWGRDSAVYRVTGVLNVIGGWFATALIAFVVAGIFVLLIYSLEWVAVLLLIAAAGIFIYRSLAYHRRKDEKKQKRMDFDNSTDQIRREQLLEQLTDRICSHLQLLKDTYDQAIKGLITEREKTLKKSEESIRFLKEKNEEFQYQLYQSIRRIEEDDAEGSNMLLYVYDLEQDMLQSAELIASACQEYVSNRLNPLKETQRAQVEELRSEIGDYFLRIVEYLQNHESKSELLFERKRELLQQVEAVLGSQVRGVKSGEYNARNSQLMFRILLESKDLIAVTARFVKLYDRVYHAKSESANLSFAVEKVKV